MPRAFFRIRSMPPSEPTPHAFAWDRAAAPKTPFVIELEGRRRRRRRPVHAHPHHSPLHLTYTYLSRSQCSDGPIDPCISDSDPEISGVGTNGGTVLAAAVAPIGVGSQLTPLILLLPIAGGGFRLSDLFGALGLSLGGGLGIFSTLLVLVAILIVVRWSEGQCGCTGPSPPTMRLYPTPPPPPFPSPTSIRQRNAGNNNNNGGCCLAGCCAQPTRSEPRSAESRSADGTADLDDRGGVRWIVTCCMGLGAVLASPFVCCFGACMACVESIRQARRDEQDMAGSAAGAARSAPPRLVPRLSTVSLHAEAGNAVHVAPAAGHGEGCGDPDTCMLPEDYFRPLLAARSVYFNVPVVNPRRANIALKVSASAEGDGETSKFPPLRLGMGCRAGTVFKYVSPSNDHHRSAVVPLASAVSSAPPTPLG